MLRGRISNCTFSAEPFLSSHFNLHLTLFLLATCVVLVSAPKRQVFLVSGTRHRAAIALQCQRILGWRHCTLQNPAMQSSLWGSFGSRDLPLYASSPKLQIRQNQMSIAPSCHTGLRIPTDLKGAMAAINEPHQIIDICDDLPVVSRSKIFRIEICN